MATCTYLFNGDLIATGMPEIKQFLFNGGLERFLPNENAPKLVGQVDSGVRFSKSSQEEKIKALSGIDKISTMDEAQTGEPILVKSFHGTDADFEEFKDDLLGFNTNAKSAEGGHFFTDSPRAAARYPVYDKELLLNYSGYFKKPIKPDGFDLMSRSEQNEWLSDEKERIMLEETIGGKFNLASEKLRKSLNKLGRGLDNFNGRLIQALESAFNNGFNTRQEYFDNKSPADYVDNFLKTASEKDKNKIETTLSLVREYIAAEEAASDYNWNYKFSSQAWEGGTADDSWEEKKENLQPNIMPVYTWLNNPNADRIMYINNNIVDILSKLEEVEGFEIRC